MKPQSNDEQIHNLLAQAHDEANLAGQMRLASDKGTADIEQRLANLRQSDNAADKRPADNADDYYNADKILDQVGIGVCIIAVRGEMHWLVEIGNLDTDDIACR